MNWLKELETTLSALRQSKPLVLCLTNVVTMDLMANSLLALGAVPLMSQAEEELEELISLSQAVYINQGTLDKPFCARAGQALRLANQQQKPVILDPVGAGASRLRTEAAKSLLPFADIIRGNASEVLTLADEIGEPKGVEASRTVRQAELPAKKLANSLQKTVVVSGLVDFVTNGEEAIQLPFGSPLMPLVTGMGCSQAAVIAAFAAIGSNSYKDALLATAYFGLCGLQGQQRTQEPGTFRQHFIDALFNPNWALFADQPNRMEIQ